MITSRRTVFVLIAIGFISILAHRHSGQLMRVWSGGTAGQAQLERQQRLTVSSLADAGRRPPAAPALRPSAVTDDQQPKELILVRTVPGRSVAEGRAFIGTDVANPQTYAAGAVLATGARITEIHADHVVLARDGRLSRMYVAGAEHLAPAANETLPAEHEVQPEIPRPPLTEEVLANYIRPSPVYDGPVLRGYQVYPGRVSHVFSQMGLKPGDVVLAIDGTAFSDPAQAMEMFRQLPGGQMLLATVERAGQRESLRLDGSLIVNDHLRSQAAVAGAPTLPPPSGFQ